MLITEQFFFDPRPLFLIVSKSSTDDDASFTRYLASVQLLLLDTGYCRLCASIDQTWTNNATMVPPVEGGNPSKCAVPGPPYWVRE
jgi:hypothetical protein